MILKNLISYINYDKVWKVLMHEYCLEKNYYEVYKSILKELNNIQPRASNPSLKCIVAKLQNCFKPDEFIYEVFGIIEGDESHYALEMNDWEEWVSYDILDKSIKAYGREVVMAHILYEMTFFGFSSKDVSKKIRKEKKLLEKTCREIRSEAAELINYEDAMKEFEDIDMKKDEEREEERRQFNQIVAKNDRVYKWLLDTGK